MLSRFRYVFGTVFFLLIASCSGAGCGGCSGCAGMTPLPGGFPTDKTVENAASVRVSRPGIDFLEQNLGPIASKAAGGTNGVFTFDIPESSFDGTVSGKICPGGPKPNANPPTCRAVIDLNTSTFKIDSITPNAITVDAVIPIALNNTPVDTNIIDVKIGYGANGACNGGNVSVDPKPLPIKVVIPLVAETLPPRAGYTKVDIDNATIDLSAIQSDDVRICCGALAFICDPIVNSDFIKGTLVDQLKSGIDAQIKGMLKDSLCTLPNPALNPPCPIGTGPDGANKYCVFDSDKAKCVPALLGTDSHVELGGLLAAFSPSTTGGLDFGLGSFGAMKPAPGLPLEADAGAPNVGRSPNGITLAMAGGVLPQPPSKCVVQKQVAPPTGVPIPNELNPTVVDPAGTPHVGIAVSGRFLDYSITNVYNSGLLCLGISTEQVDLLKSGLLSFLIPSIKTLTFEQTDAAAAIATRPQEPPVLKLGGGTDLSTDPLLLVTLPKFAIDFYIWSFDRYARVFTYTGDLTIPINLQTGKGPNNPNGGLLPALGDIKVANGQVTNGELLLLDDPGVVAGAVSGIFGTVSKQLVGAGMTPIDISSSLAQFGVNLDINTIKKMTQGTEDYLGIFATLSKAAGTAFVESDTQAKLVGKRVWKDHMQANTYERAKLPELELDFSSSLDDHKRAIEYSWWIDGGTRSAWSKAKHAVIKDDQLFLQGKHVLHVVSRIAGDPRTEDATPADVPYVIDALAPIVKVERSNDRSATIKAWDVVSATDALVARWRLDDKPFGEWSKATGLATIDTNGAEWLEVEVKDEEGNVGTVRQALRGVADPTLASSAACGCSTPGSNDRGGLIAVVLGLAGLSLIVLRRRGGDAARRAVARGGLALGAIGLVAATSQGCACGDAEDAKTGCGSDCNQQCATGLKQGQPGAYLSVAKAKDGALWAAGYNDSLLADSDSLLWGDLVVGKLDPASQQVKWETVDGIPTRTEGCGAYEPYGWRKGETESGDNVGRYTSIQVSSKGEPMVSYYDDTNNRLKFAINAGGWKVSVLKELARADIGKYSKMLLVDGKPVIAYMHLEPGTAGRTRTKISLARAKVESPQGPNDFTFEDIAVDEDGPCTATSCATGDACIKGTGTCTKTTGGCQPACAATEACINVDNKAVCNVTANPVQTYPRGLGPFIGFATGPKGLGIVAYDGFHGNLVAFTETKGAPWQRVILDGEAGNRNDKTAIDTGDVGISASLAIDPNGTWHVSYVAGTDETLRYVTLVDGAPTRPMLVDDGFGVDGKVHADGKHIVGDDSAIRVDGERVTITYSDSSSLGIRRAVGTGAGPAKRWDLRSIKQDGRWVAFPQFVPGEEKIAAWWRQSTRATKTVEGNVVLIPQ
jgi:hypothetical protein